MKKVWKWVIGIVLGLVVLAVLVGVGFVIRNSLAGNYNLTKVYTYSQRGPEIMPFGGYGYHMRGPGMMGFGRSPIAGIFGGLFMLGFLALVVLGIIWLVRRLSAPRVVEANAGAPAASMAAAPAPSTAEPMTGAAVNPCKKCGRPLQADWSVCPYCGKKV